MEKEKWNGADWQADTVDWSREIVAVRIQLHLKCHSDYAKKFPDDRSQWDWWHLIQIYIYIFVHANFRRLLFDCVRYVQRMDRNIFTIFYLFHNESW